MDKDTQLRIDRIESKLKEHAEKFNFDLIPADEYDGDRVLCADWYLVPQNEDNPVVGIEQGLNYLKTSIGEYLVTSLELQVELSEYPSDFPFEKFFKIIDLFLNEE